MKVVITKRSDTTMDVRIRRTRRSEGKGTQAKGLTRAELRPYLDAELPKMEHPDLPGTKPG